MSSITNYDDGADTDDDYDDDADDNGDDDVFLLGFNYIIRPIYFLILLLTAILFMRTSDQHPIH